MPQQCSTLILDSEGYSESPLNGGTSEDHVELSLLIEPR
jgi:hypothetical protein